MTHPLHAPDDVGRICGEMGPWALDFARYVAVASSNRHPKAERVAATTKAHEYWPKLCRLMAELERASPASLEAGSLAHQRMMDVVEAVNG